MFTYIKIYVDKNHICGDFSLNAWRIQAALAGRMAILSLTSLSQAEINHGKTEPFTIDLEKLTARKDERVPADTKRIFERIFRGSMPTVISGQNSNSQIFYSSYLSTYIERDVKELSTTIDSLNFLSFITAVQPRQQDVGKC